MRYSNNQSLHEILCELQHTNELKRKSDKSYRKGYYTQENIDYAYRKGMENSEKLKSLIL